MNALHKLYMVSHPMRISRYGAHTSLSSAERVEIMDTLLQILATTLSILAQLKRGQQKLRTVSFLPVKQLFSTLVQANVDYADFLVTGITDLGGHAEFAGLYSLNDTSESQCFADCLMAIGQSTDRLEATGTLLREYRESAVTNRDSASKRFFEECTRRNARFMILLKNHLNHEQPC